MQEDPANLADITLPTGGLEGWMSAIFSPEFLGIAAACLIVGYFLKKVYDSLPKWVLIVLALVVFALLGIIKF